MVMDSEAKNAAPSTATRPAPSSRQGASSNDTPSTSESTMTTTACDSARIPAAKALPVTSAERGVGVTMSLLSTPASRSR